MKTIHFDQVPEEKVPDPEASGVFIRVLIGPNDGADNFVMRRFRVAPGGHTPRHTHDWEHEVFVLAGEGELFTPEGPKPIKAGDAILVDPKAEHQFTNTGSQDLEFLCLIPNQ